MDVAVGVLTGDPAVGVEALVKQVGSQGDLEALSDRELLRKASREMLVMVNLVCEALRSQLPSLVATKQIETATLLNSLVAALRAARDGLEQFEHLPAQAGHAVKESRCAGDCPCRTEYTACHPGAIQLRCPGDFDCIEDALRRQWQIAEYHEAVLLRGNTCAFNHYPPSSPLSRS
jgi:hypothetical protein